MPLAALRQLAVRLALLALTCVAGNILRNPNKKRHQQGGWQREL
jgi:hypothetical protein